MEHLREAAELSGLDPRDVMLPASRHIVLDGMRFHYLDWAGPHPSIVFLHGGGLTAHTWDLVCVALRSQHRCFALDQRGHGDSEWSPEMDYTREAHFRDLNAFLDALWLDRLILVGQSMGGINALTFAARFPRRVLGLVLVDVGPDVRTEGAARIAEFMRGPGELSSIEEFVERAVAFNPRRHPALLRRSLRHNLRQLPDGKWTWKRDPRPFERADFMERFSKQPLTELWSEIELVTCPTLVVRGAESDVFTDAQAAELAERLPDGRWVRVEGAGHNVQGDNPRGMAEAISAFLADTDGESAA